MPEFSGQVLLLANYAPDEQESMQRFARMLLDGLGARGISVSVIQPKPRFGKASPSAGGLGKWLGYIDKIFVFPRQLKRRLSTLTSRDVLHICDHSSAIYIKVAARTPHLVTCHDMLAVRSAFGEFPENPTRATGKRYQQMILKGLNRARRVVCVSQATFADVRRLTRLQPEQVAVIENGLNYPYHPMDRPEALDRLATKVVNPSSRFILHVGGNQWYKNRRGVIGIYGELVKLLPDAPDLFLAGKPLPPELHAQIAAANIRERVHELRDCDNEDLCALYSLAQALLFPSLAEGFGWPIVEAHACGCSVATSMFPPMNEVGADAALYLDPHDWPAAAIVLRDLLWEPGLEKAIRKKKGLANAARFAAHQMIDRYIAEYAALIAAG